MRKINKKICLEALFLLGVLIVALVLTGRCIADERKVQKSWSKTKISKIIKKIHRIKITNVRDVTFNVSWVSPKSETCKVIYGIDPHNLSNVCYDDRGKVTVDDTHYVTIKNLSPTTLYYFDIVSGDVTYDNGGAHYTCTTSPTIGLPDSDTVYGRVFKEDGVTYAEGTIVYIRLEDNNGAGSAGFSAEMSALVDSSGYWFINFGNARTQDLSAYFSYSSSGDNLILYAQGAGDGTASQTVDTGSDFPAADMILFVAVLDVEVDIFNDAGYSQKDKFFNAGTISVNVEDDRYHTGDGSSPNFMTTPILVLGISVEPTTWAIDNLAEEDISQSGLFTVTNTGSISETFSLSIEGPSSPSDWTAGSSPDNEIYVLKGFFGPTSDGDPTDLFLSDDIITMGTPSSATNTQFGDTSLTLNGVNVEAAGERGLWFQFQAPSSASYGDEQQSTTKNIGAKSS